MRKGGVHQKSKTAERSKAKQHLKKEVRVLRTSYPLAA